MFFLRVIFFTVATFLPFLSSAFSPGTTHPAVTGQGVDFYNSFTEEKITEEQKIWLMQGSTDEDDNTRSLYHFYDPINNRGIKGARSAKTWAQYSKNDYSWQKAKDLYISGEEKDAYIALGHIIHLLQDMFVPDHTRDDAHLPYDESVFEVWAGENRNKETLKNLSTDMLTLGFTLKNLDTLDDYFDFSAGYSNGNFFSKDTIEDKKYKSPIITKYIDRFGYGEDNLLLDSHILLKTKVDEEGDIYKFLYNHKDGDASIVSDYFSRLSKRAVVVQAGVMKLFFEEVEKMRLEKQDEQKAESKILIFIKKINNSIRNGFNLIINTSGPSNMATVYEGLHVDTPVFVSLSDTGLSSSFSENTSQYPPEWQDPLPIQQNLSDQEIEDLVGVSKEDILRILQEAIKETQKAEVRQDEQPTQFSFYLSGGGGVSTIQDPVGNVDDNSTTTATSTVTAKHGVSLVTPNNFSEVFVAPTIIFSGTTTPHSLVLSSYSNATTTADKDGNWNLSENFQEGTSTISFTSTFEEKVATTSEFSIKVHFLSDEPEIVYSSCDLSFVKNKCVIATSTFSLLWNSEEVGTSTYNLSFQNEMSTTTSASSVYTNLTDGIYRIGINTIDDLGFLSATTTLNFEIITQPVVINEIAWSGEASSSDEWIELYNRTNYEIDLENWSLYSSDLIPNISLQNTIGPKEYFLIERKLSNAKDELPESPIKDIVADAWVFFGGSINNAGENLTLSYQVEQQGITTEIISDYVSLCTDWCGYGGGTKHLSMERWNVDLPSDWEDSFGGSNWGSNIEIVRNGLNKNGVEINGTPKKRNSISYKPVNNNYFTGDLTLMKDKSPYLIYGSLFIDGATSSLNVEDGVIIKFADAPKDKSFIASYGKVSINGKADSEVLFTSIYDSEVGDDLVMTGVSSTTSMLQMGGLYIFDQLDESDINNAVFKNMKQSLSVYDSPLNIRDSLFQDGNGLWIFGSDIKANNVSFKNIKDNALGVFEDAGNQVSLKVKK